MRSNSTYEITFVHYLNSAILILVSSHHAYLSSNAYA